jgi:hypothetical protein
MLIKYTRFIEGEKDMRWFVVVLLLVAAHFSLTPFAPAKEGKALLYWPFAADSRSWLGFVGGLPTQSGSALTPIIAGLAGLGFIAAIVGLFWTGFPPNWWRAVVIASAALSILLYILFFGKLAILPIVLDLVILWGILFQEWSIADLRGV